LIAWTRAAAEQGAAMPPETKRLMRWKLSHCSHVFLAFLPDAFFSWELQAITHS